MVPALTNLPDGCVFAPRCAHAEDRCRARLSRLTRRSGRGHWAACWRSAELFGDRNG